MRNGIQSCDPDFPSHFAACMDTRRYSLVRRRGHVRHIPHLFGFLFSPYRDCHERRYQCLAYSHQCSAEFRAQPVPDNSEGPVSVSCTAVDRRAPHHPWHCVARSGSSRNDCRKFWTWLSHCGFAQCGRPLRLGSSRHGVNWSNWSITGHGDALPGNNTISAVGLFRRLRRSLMITPVVVSGAQKATVPGTAPNKKPFKAKLCVEAVSMVFDRDGDRVSVLDTVNVSVGEEEFV